MIPITVFTGFLGVGKTTIIINLIKSLPSSNYNIVILKNEFGDLNVDSQIAKFTNNNVKVTEMLNGCFCCVLVGKMKNALIDIRNQFKPDRIIIETSGSAFPAPIAWQLRELADEGFKLDSIITVIDSINFRGYEDTSYTAKMQAKYTDLIIMNKSELVSEREYDLVMDKVYELNEDTPKVKAGPKGMVDPNLVFGLDTKLFQLVDKEKDEKLLEGVVDTGHHYKEVELISILINSNQSSVKNNHDHDLTDDCIHKSHHHQSNTNNISSPHQPQPVILHTTKTLSSALSSLPSDYIYRIKGFLLLSDKTYNILNYAFGRHELIPINNYEEDSGIVAKLTVMGVELQMVMGKLKETFGVRDGYDLFQLNKR